MPRHTDRFDNEPTNVSDYDQPVVYTFEMVPFQTVYGLGDDGEMKRLDSWDATGQKGTWIQTNQPFHPPDHRLEFAGKAEATEYVEQMTDGLDITDDSVVFEWGRRTVDRDAGEVSVPVHTEWGELTATFALDEVTDDGGTAVPIADDADGREVELAELFE